MPPGAIPKFYFYDKMTFQMTADGLIHKFDNESFVLNVYKAQLML